MNLLTLLLPTPSAPVAVEASTPKPRGRWKRRKRITAREKLAAQERLRAEIREQMRERNARLFAVSRTPELPPGIKVVEQEGRVR